MAKMDNKILLSDWLDDFTKNTVDRREILYGLSLAMQKENNNQNYILNFDPTQIAVNYTNNRQVLLHNTVHAFAPEAEEYKKIDIKMLATFAVGMYIEWPWRNGLLNAEVLGNNFETYAYLLPSEDTDYFRRVLVNNEPLYYSDYRQKLEEQQKEQNQTGLASTGPKLVLANAAQTGVVQDVYDDSQQDEKKDSKAAFSTSAFLVVSFSVVCGLMMVLAYVLAM
ncbi:unknown [Bacillus sp. CAG:988]|nr:unknown [Bacillus sp. CAG:988]